MCLRQFDQLLFIFNTSAKVYVNRRKHVFIARIFWVLSYNVFNLFCCCLDKIKLSLSRCHMCPNPNVCNLKIHFVFAKKNSLSNNHLVQFMLYRSNSVPPDLYKTTIRETPFSFTYIYHHLFVF